MDRRYWSQLKSAIPLNLYKNKTIQKKMYIFDNRFINEKGDYSVRLAKKLPFNLDWTGSQLPVFFRSCLLYLVWDCHF